MVPQGPTPGNQALTHSSTLPDGAALTASPAIADALAALLEHDVGEWPRRGLQEQKRRSVRRVFKGALGDAEVYVKVFRADTIAAKARDALRRRHKGEREAAHLRAALDAGLPAVEPLAFGLAREGESLCSFLVTRSVDAASLELPCGAERADGVGRLLRRVHDSGLLPGDLHPGNLLVRPDGQPVLCDLTSMQQTGVMSARQRAAGLAFFCNPIDGGPLDPALRALLDSILGPDAEEHQDPAERVAHCVQAELSGGRPARLRLSCLPSQVGGGAIDNLQAFCQARELPFGLLIWPGVGQVDVFLPESPDAAGLLELRDQVAAAEVRLQALELSPELVAVLREDTSRHPKTVVFTHFTATQKLVVQRLDREGIRYDCHR